jgi:hypothetical protein
MATNLLRPGPLSVRGHLVALAQIERGYRAFGLSGASATRPANAERPGPRRRRPGDPTLHLSITLSMRPRPLDYHLARVTYVAYLPPGGGRGQARVGFDPGLAWTLRTATPEAASDVSYLIDARIRSARRARDRVIGYDLCVASVRTRLYRLYV